MFLVNVAVHVVIHEPLFSFIRVLIYKNAFRALKCNKNGIIFYASNYIKVIA
nr:MAG TPA: hypothetical protein [Caudoviricetes sp.]